MSEFIISNEHRIAVQRKRRTILHLDALGEAVMRGMEPQSYIKYIFGYADNTENQIDCIFWDMMFSGDFYSMYQSSILPKRRGKAFEMWNKCEIDIFELLVDSSKKRKYENFLVHRISEVDIEPDSNPITAKLEHPEWFIKCWNTSGLFNLAIADVREHKVKILREVLENYDFDGLEIDFARHTPFLEPGRQWELRENVTELMRMMRVMTLDIEKIKGSPVMLSARIPETLEGCKQDGIDVWSFVKENLVDMLTLGSRSLSVDLTNFRKLTHGKNIKLYPCYDEHHASDGYMNPPIEVFRGVFSSWWDMGADGIKLFNWYTCSDEDRNTILTKLGIKAKERHRHSQATAYEEAGDFEGMKFLDKTFVAERKGGYPWAEGYFNRNDGKPLPMLLHNCGTVKDLDIYVSDIVSSYRSLVESLTLNLILYGTDESDKIKVWINGSELSNGIYDNHWNEFQVWAPQLTPISGNVFELMKCDKNRKLLKIVYELDCGSIVKGLNRIELSLEKGFGCDFFNNVTLEKAEIRVIYKK